MLVKSFTDDLAWQVQRELVNGYFKPREPKPVPTSPVQTCLPTFEKTEQLAPNLDTARQNWFNYMLTVLEERLGLSKENMLHQAYEGMKKDGTNPEIVKVRYIERTGRVNCSTFEAVINDRIAALELAEILCQNMEIVLIKRSL